MALICKLFIWIISLSALQETRECNPYQNSNKYKNVKNKKPTWHSLIHFRTENIINIVLDCKEDPTEYIRKYTFSSAKCRQSNLQNHSYQEQNQKRKERGFFLFLFVFCFFINLLLEKKDNHTSPIPPREQRGRQKANWRI